MSIISDLYQYINPSPEMIASGGLALVALIVYAETGLFFCFWLPGDYLLFTAGVLVGTGGIDVGIGTLMATLLAAAVAGNYTGFFFGRYMGTSLENRKDSLFFKKQYIENTRQAFDKYGGMALVVGRFLPIVRTFAPILAGVVRMSQRQFFFYNILGAILWAGLLPGIGYWLGVEYGEQIMKLLPYIIAGFILFTTITVIRTYLGFNKGVKKENAG